MLRDCFLQLCRRSVYAYEDELQQGYFTVQGGCRIGVAGCRGPGGFSAVTSLNLRIARWITCPLPPALEEAVAARAGGLLLAGPPGSGKTTLLRSIVQRLCESDSLVSVIDERGELMACETGSLPRAAQIRCDVYARCSKPEGIAMALRNVMPVLAALMVTVAFFAVGVFVFWPVLLVAPGLASYCNAFLFNRIFDKYGMTLE